MAKMMLKWSEDKLYFYIAMKDMEEVNEKIEFDEEENLGREIELLNG